MKLSKEAKNKVTLLRKRGCGKANGVIRWLGEYNFSDGKPWVGLPTRQAKHEKYLNAKAPVTSDDERSLILDCLCADCAGSLLYLLDDEEDCCEDEHP